MRNGNSNRYSLCARYDPRIPRVSEDMDALRRRESHDGPRTGKFTRLLYNSCA